MSDYDEIEDVTEDEPKRNWRRDLEDKAREADEAKAAADAARRELAFVKAGIDPDNLTPQQKLFVKAYDGQPTVEAIKAAAVEYGVLEAPAPAVPAEELAALERVTQASAGAGTADEAHDALAELSKISWTEPGAREAVLATLQKAGVGVDDSRPGGFMRPESMGSVPL